MKNKLTALAAAFVLALTASASLAADTSIEGTVRGYLCVVLGKSCPVDKEDPIVAAENVFVVARPDGSYYLVPNVDRAILARHMTEKVRVTGVLDETYRAIRAKTIETYVTATDGWKTTWSQALEEEARQLLYGR